jgi:uncharacterized protein (DUF433 family)
MNPRIQITPTVCHGKPVIRGTRVLVSTILGALSGGDTIEMVLQDYPSITAEDVAAALEFAGRLSDYQAPFEVSTRPPMLLNSEHQAAEWQEALGAY